MAIRQPVPIAHPCWSGRVLVFAEGAAEPVPSSDSQSRDLLGVGDRVGERVQGCGGSGAPCPGPGFVADGNVVELSQGVVMPYQSDVGSRYGSVL